MNILKHMRDAVSDTTRRLSLAAHLLRNLFTFGHRPIVLDVTDGDKTVLVVRCQCGRVF